jgi:dihydropteroate synthase
MPDVDVIIDPGFGFAKTIAHNFQVAQRPFRI